MKQVTLYIPDKQFSFFMELMQSLKFVEISKNSEIELTKEQTQTWENVKKGFEELDLVSKGKAKTRPLKQLLDEL